MIPAGPHPLMMCGDADPLDEYMKIANSVRFNPPDSPSLSRTTSASGGDRDKWWVFVWFKRSALDTVQYLHGADTASADAIFINASNKLCIDIAGSARLISTGVFRDLIAHGGLLVVFDAANATNAQKLRAFYTDSTPSVTGEITAWDTDTRSAITAGTAKTMHNSITHVIGKSPTAANGYWAGYISEHRIGTWSGAQPTLTDHCARHTKTGQWRPKSYGGAYGAGGSRLDFSDGSVADATHLGKDRSGNNNNWTPANISVAPGVDCDVLNDTPTNVFPTWDFLDPVVVAGQSALTNGNLTLATNTMYLGYNGGHSNIPFPIGKWYAEFHVIDNTGSLCIALDFEYEQRTNYYPGTTLTSFAYASGGGKGNNASWTAYGNTYGNGDVIGLLYDGVAGKLYFSKNGVVQNSGDPIAGTGYAFAGLPTNAQPTVWVGDQSGTAGYFCTLSANFGQRPFAYAPPPEFKALCTKNLPVRPSGPMKSSSAFVAVTDSGANIQTALAAAAQWTDWIRIFKRREASEGWRWVFSDDPTNYLDTSGTAAKAALPAFSGTSYVGYALKVSAANGVATGTFVHTNGAASVISDGLSNARKMVILHRESVGGGAFYCYHPDLTAGKLIYLNTMDVETTDASINSVTAGGFTAAAALPSGTYRWVSLAEVGDFLKLGKHAGNSSADGPFQKTGMMPAFRFVKNIGAAGYSQVSDSARNTYNVVTKKVSFSSALEENNVTPNGGDTQNTCDFVAGGWKIRDTDSPTNGAYNYVSMTIAAFPFRYANAR